MPDEAEGVRESGRRFLQILRAKTGGKRRVATLPDMWEILYGQMSVCVKGARLAL